MRRVRSEDWQDWLPQGFLQRWRLGLFFDLHSSDRGKGTHILSRSQIFNYHYNLPLVRFLEANRDYRNALETYVVAKNLDRVWGSSQESRLTVWEGGQVVVMATPRDQVARNPQIQKCRLNTIEAIKDLFSYQLAVDGKL